MISAIGQNESERTSTIHVDDPVIEIDKDTNKNDYDVMQTWIHNQYYSIK